MATTKPTIKSNKDIRAKLLNPSLTSHFLCQFDIPKKFRDSKFYKDRTEAGYYGLIDNIENRELISLSCSEASLPGSSMATIDIDNDYHGVSEKHAYRRLFDDRADFTFYVDSDYKIIHFFENWISYCVSEDNIKEQQNSNYFYRVNYPDNYKTPNLYIIKFERNFNENQRALNYRFINAYPISINSMPLSYDASNILKCTVSFFYSRYIMTPGYIPREFKETSSALNTVPDQTLSSTTLNIYGRDSKSQQVTINDGQSIFSQIYND